VGTVDRHVDVLVAHTLQDGLMRDRVVVPGEGHILFAQAGQGRGDLGSIAWVLGVIATRYRAAGKFGGSMVSG
jgi:hypothetical protein